MAISRLENDGSCWWSCCARWFVIYAYAVVLETRLERGFVLILVGKLMNGFIQMGIFESWKWSNVKYHFLVAKESLI